MNRLKMIKKFSFLFLTVLLFICSTVVGQQKELNRLTDQDCLGAGSASVLVYDLESKEELYFFDPQRALPTASIQKMMSSAAALHEKGRDYRFLTQIGFDGEIREGVLDGDLIVLGSGDPSLGSEYFPDLSSIDEMMDEVVAKIKDEGIRIITGGISVYVSSVRGQHVPGGWSWSSLGNYYGAGHWGVNIHDNEFRVYFNQNSTPGARVPIDHLDPEIPGYTLRSEVTSGPQGSGDQAYIYAAPYSDEGIIRGTIPPGNGQFSIRGSIPDPPFYFGKILRDALTEQGIVIKESVRVSSSSPVKWTNLVTWSSPPLVEIARITNYESVNMYAESLMKLLCEENDPVDHHRCGVRNLASFWKSKGVDDKSFFFTDGSGLSARNTASARSFVSALAAIYRETKWYDTFVSTLPKMGRDGTLKYMMRDYKGSGSISAKSGYIGRQRSYAGYITTEHGRNLAFCIIVDNYSCSGIRMRNKIEDFLIAVLRQ